MRRRAFDGCAWAARSIRAGTVRFYGKVYRVSPTQRTPPVGMVGREWQSDPPYDGRLDGKRALFYSYHPEHASLADSIFLHSFPNPDAEDGMDWPGPNCIDGYFIWERWREVKP